VARPTHPALIDTTHVLADLYHMVNVPTVVWIDERGRIVRPNDVAFGTDTFKHITGLAARAEFGLGRWLWARGRTDAAERHFLRGGALAPHDFTIRRGTMPMRGLDPMGPEFRAMLQSWVGAGHRYYRPLPA
jgi:hypothetical protein